MVQNGFIDISDEYLTGLSGYVSSEKCVPQSLILQSASPDSLSWREGIAEVPRASGKWHALSHKHFSGLCLHHGIWSHPAKVSPESV